jgi:CDP-diacylglycerol pyrophosphatase
MSKLLSVVVALAFVCACTAQQPAPAQNSPASSQSDETDPHVILWRIARQCKESLTKNSGCRAYVADGDQEYAIIKDNSPVKPQAYLIIPVARVTGIEDPRVLTAPLSKLWQSAWLWAAEYPGFPPSRTGLEINSAMARSQNQLHIHISCVLPEVTDALSKADIPSDPQKAITMTFPSDRSTYRVVRVENLRDANSPFVVVGKMAGVDANNMKDQSILVVAAQKQPGFYVLDTTADGPGTGYAEDLLDQKCQ